MARRAEQPRFNTTDSKGRNIKARELSPAQVEAARQEALKRLAEDVKAGVFSPDKLIPPRKVLAEKHGVSEAAVDSAMWELEQQKLLTRATGNRHIVSCRQNTTGITSRDLMLREIQQHFGTVPFTCSELHTATGGFIEQ
ncbi:GntR family transcriptional regulator [Streptomyces sp. NPDC048604]|uniref:GntR family transcriptional regulator n=1 Tax=Streptomyces sp. NPDC048604 TaxID=3365578 RepID=UPI0037213A58